MVIKIGTRKSKLALVQTEIVKQKIASVFPNIKIEVIPISTKGDEILDRSLTSLGGKGVFTKELEEALLRGDIDLAVHSAKDMPMEFPDGLHVGAVLDRANPGDILITKTGIKAKDLKAGSVIGTSSLRRELQIKEINPTVAIKLLRGNVQTRIGKLVADEYDGILLAAAGIERLNLENAQGLHFEYLDMEEFIPAAGQGILAVENRKDELVEIMSAIHSKEAAIMLASERNFLAVLGGGCNSPCGAISSIEHGVMTMKTMHVNQDGERRIAKGSVELSTDDLENSEKGIKKALDLGETLAKKLKYKKVYLIGAGPGDKGLLTNKGLECIKRADVIVYDNLVSPSILNEARMDAELIYGGKRAGNHHLSQHEINQLLIDKALDGNMVVRLKGGDPFIFGRGGEEAAALLEHEVLFEIVPGVSSSYAVAAYAGIPVTHRNMASSFHVITGHEGNNKTEPSLDYETLSKEDGTLIFMMGLANLKNITKSLIEKGKDKNTKVAVVQAGTTARQRKVVGTLENIVEKVKQSNIKTPAVTIVGEVVSLEETLEWYGNQKLFGKRVLLTGTKPIVEKMSDVLTSCGAEAIELSLIYTKPIYSKEMSEAVASIKEYQWIVFTSNNGVDIFFQYLKDMRIDIRKLMHIKFAVIGEGIGKALSDRGFQYDYMPSKYSSEDLAKEWLSTLSHNDKLLLLRAKKSSKFLLEALDNEKMEYDDIPLYETVYDTRKQEELNRLVGDMDYITFASASAVDAFYSMITDLEEIKGKIICIGPVTEKAAIKKGLQVYQSATTYTAEGIRDVIIHDVNMSNTTV